MGGGRQFRESLRHTMPGAPKKSVRIVPGFTIQSLQKNTVVEKPPKLNATKPLPYQPSAFQKFYKRGDFPISVECDEHGKKVGWKVDVAKLDYHYYLPMFFEGLREPKYPYKFLAYQGVYDMLNRAPEKVFPVIPQLIIPIKKALCTKNKDSIVNTCKVLQYLVKHIDMAGVALVPYYRQILPTLNVFKDLNVNCGDNIDYSQQHGTNVGDIINETLEILERFGGEDAYINIKYMIPTYESCMQN